MKKILTILLLSAVALIGSQAKWNVEGYNSDFSIKGYKTVTFDYTGQSITLAGQKTITGTAYNLTYTGADSLRDGYTYHGIEPIVVWGDSIVWVRIDSRIVLDLTN